MSSEGVRLLTKHLAAVKAEAADTITTLQAENANLKSENARLQSQLQTLLEELDFRHGQIEQLKLENNRKWRVEERDDWKYLVESIQHDREELHRANDELRQEVLALEARVAGKPDRGDADTAADAPAAATAEPPAAEPMPPPPPPRAIDSPCSPLSASSTVSSDSSSGMARPAPIITSGLAPRTPRTHSARTATDGRRMTPTTTRLREQLAQTQEELLHERSVLESERREAQRLRRELDARREREKRSRQSAGLLYRLARMTNLFHRGQLITTVSAPVILNV